MKQKITLNGSSSSVYFLAKVCAVFPHYWHTKSKFDLQHCYFHLHQTSLNCLLFELQINQTLVGYYVPTLISLWHTVYVSKKTTVQHTCLLFTWHCLSLIKASFSSNWRSTITKIRDAVYWHHFQLSQCKTCWGSSSCISGPTSRSMSVTTSVFFIGFSGMRKWVRQHLYGKAASVGGRG